MSEPARGETGLTGERMELVFLKKSRRDGMTRLSSFETQEVRETAGGKEESKQLFFFYDWE